MAGLTVWFAMSILVQLVSTVPASQLYQPRAVQSPSDDGNATLLASNSSMGLGTLADLRFLMRTNGVPMDTASALLNLLRAMGEEAEGDYGSSVALTGLYLPRLCRGTAVSVDLVNGQVRLPRAYLLTVMDRVIQIHAVRSRNYELTELAVDIYQREQLLATLTVRNYDWPESDSPEGLLPHLDVNGTTWNSSFTIDDNTIGGNSHTSGILPEPSSPIAATSPLPFRGNRINNPKLTQRELTKDPPLIPEDVSYDIFETRGFHISTAAAISATSRLFLNVSILHPEMPFIYRYAGFESEPTLEGAVEVYNARFGIPADPAFDVQTILAVLWVFFDRVLVALEALESQQAQSPRAALHILTRPALVKVSTSRGNVLLGTLTYQGTTPRAVGESGGNVTISSLASSPAIEKVS